MLPTPNNFAWIMAETKEGENPSLCLDGGGNGGAAQGGGGANPGGSQSNFMPVLEAENQWYTNNSITHNQHWDDPKDFSFSTDLPKPEILLLQQQQQQLIGPSESSSSSIFPFVFNGEEQNHHQYLLPSNPNTTAMDSVLNFMPQNNPYEVHGFVNGSGFSELGSIQQMGFPNLSSNPQFTPTHFVPALENGNLVGSGGEFGGGFDENLGNSMFTNRSKLLKPLDNSPSIGEQPTLFQKRAALRKNLDSNGLLDGSENDNVTLDGSSLNYDSDGLSETFKMEEGNKKGGMGSNASGALISGADPKGKKKGMPSKNLMAERRRRQKLNDRLYMLRSIVPKISKMDRASILGDAVEYLKELMQKINDLQNELESTPSTSSMPQAKILRPPTPTIPYLPSQIKEELCPASLPSPNGEPARIEVRLREGKTMNIHMFCGKKPGLLLSTMKALDNVGLDVQQAVINCFNGFTMDIFHAEQYKEGQDLHPEHIKTLLLESAGLLCGSMQELNFTTFDNLKGRMEVLSI
ncbi:hypothetical protein V2J09_011905 [Rumex salicifolius]